MLTQMCLECEKSSSSWQLEICWFTSVEAGAGASMRAKEKRNKGWE